MRTAPSNTDIIVNVGGYYIGWLACVLGAAWDQWLTGAAIGLFIFAAHLLRSVDRGGEVRLALVVLAVGFSVDSAQTVAGVLRFDTGQPVAWLAPLWIGVMWLLFATTLRVAFGWLEGRPLLAALTGAVGGPAAFYAGERLGAVAFHPTAGLSLSVLAIVWAALMPLLMRLASTPADGSTT